MEKNSAILVSCMVVILVILLMFQGPISLIFQPNAIEIPTTRNNGALSSMRFERNDGQTDPQVDFILRGRDHHLLFSPTSVRFNGIHPGSGIADPVHFSSIEIHFVDAHPDAVGRGLDRLITRSNYFIGNDPERWNTDIPNFARIRYDGIYDGIDLVYYNNGETLEFDYVVAPGHDPGRIRMRFAGHDDLKHRRRGDLVISAGTAEVILKKPMIYQEMDGQKAYVDGTYVIEDDEVGFDVEPYDEDLPLIIDPPVLMYGTYLGGSGTDIAYGIAADASGCAYVTGSTLSLDFPTSPGSFQQVKAPGPTFLTDVFVTKFSSDFSTVLYSTYLGGRGEDRGNGIAVDNNGNAYITGMTYSHDETGTPEIESFPLMNEYQGDPGSIYEEDVFVTKLNASGSALLYSTYLGGDGEDDAQDIAIDAYGDVYITGINFSFDYPIRSAYMPDKPSYYYDGFVTKINPSLSGDASLIYSTFLGGEANDDYAYGIAVDAAGHAYVTGTTESTDFPTQNPYQAAKNGIHDDAFVAKLSTDGKSLVWSTYLGGTGQEWGYAIAVNASGNAYVTGNTSSSMNFPVTPGVVYESTFYPFFVTKFNSSGSDLEYSTFCPVGNDIALDDEGYAYVIGTTVSSTLPLENEIQHNLNGTSDAFIIRFEPAASKIEFASYLGGESSENGNSIAVLDSNNIFVTGLTTSEHFPAVHTPHRTPYQETSGGGLDAFVAKIGLPRDDFVVEVWQDTLGHDAVRIPETFFDIFLVDVNKPEDPYTYLEKRQTDDKGFLYLPNSIYYPGMPFLLTKHVATRISPKEGHEIVNNKIYDVYVDNLYIDDTGKIYPEYLASDIEDTTVTYLEHTWIGINLVASIEWQASADYIDHLKTAFAKASSYLYDITDGQACLQDVAIYDDKKQWSDADIGFHASNLQWPRALRGDWGDWDRFIFLPPKFFGSERYNVNDIFIHPVKLETYTNYSTLVHELGHYVFEFYDEYIDGNMKTLKDDINFGFMDTQTRSYDPWSSEMSGIESEEHTQTMQYFEHKATCWDYVDDRFSRMHGSVRAQIHTPYLLGMTEGEYVEGPAEDELGVNACLNLIDETGPDGGERIEFHAKDDDGNSLPGVKVKLKKKSNNRYMKQGKTVLDGVNEGRIRLFGAEPGDKVFFTQTGESYRYKFDEVLAQNAGKAGSRVSTDDDAIVVVLNELVGSFTLLSQVSFDLTGELVYETLAQPTFSTDPTLELIQGSSVLDLGSLTGSADSYSTSLPDTTTPVADLLFHAPDSSGSTFFVPQALDLIAIDTTTTHIVPANNHLEIWLDSASTELTTLAILGSDFPCPTTGLPDSSRRASPVYAIYPSSSTAPLEAFLRIFYRGDTLSASVPEAVTIYRWDDEWLPMNTETDTARFQVTTRVEEPGIYAAFLDLTRTFVTGVTDRTQDVVPEGYGLHQNYPNPFNPQTTIRYDVPVQARVKLEIFDILGRRIRTLIDQTRPAGTHSAVWDGRDETGSALPSGLYLCRFQVENLTKTIRLLMMK